VRGDDAEIEAALGKLDAFLADNDLVR